MWWILRCESVTLTHQEAKRCNLDEIRPRGFAARVCFVCLCTPILWIRSVCLASNNAVQSLSGAPPLPSEVSTVLEKMFWVLPGAASLCLHTRVVILEDFSPFCHIPHWSAASFELGPATSWRLSQYWVRLPHKTGKPQGETRCSALLSTLNKEELTVKCTCVQLQLDNQQPLHIQHNSVLQWPLSNLSHLLTYLVFSLLTNIF